MRTFRASPLLALVIIAFSAWPVGARECQPTVTDGWVRLPPVSMPMLAGFGRIDNGCAAPLVIVGASSPAFADVSVHQTSIVDGVSRMRAVPELRIAADGRAVLEPRSEEHTSELQSLMRTSYAVFCLQTKKNTMT